MKLVRLLAWPRRQFAPLLVAALGLLSTLGLFRLSWERTNDARALELEHRALAQVRVLELRLAQDVAVAHSMATYVEVNDALGAAQILRFAASLKSPYREIKAVDWIPWVHREERAAVEAWGLAQGMPDFQIRVTGPDGRFLPSPEKADYCPTIYVGENTPNRYFAGFDLCSEATRREMVEKARDTGRPAISRPLNLFNSDGDSPGLLICDPTYDRALPQRTVEERRAAFRGCGLVVLVVEDFLKAIPAGVGSDLWYSFRLRDAPAQAIATRPAGVPEPDLQRSLPMRVEGVDLELRYGDLNSDWLGLYFNSMALGFSGLAITLLASVVLFSYNKQNEFEDQMRLRLVEAQHLESLGLLAGGIAHDFNNLLVGILGQASRARAAAAPGTREREMADQITRSAERAAELTRLLLAYAGKGRFSVQELNLNTLVQDVLRLIGTPEGDRPAIQVALAEGLPPVRGEVGQLQQVLLNLLSNALDATRDNGGQIRVRTALERRDQPVPVVPWMAERLPAGTYLALEIRDEGVGMDDATLRRIFDPFFTSKREGHGLGLSAVLGIIRGHNGAVDVQSALGVGTRVTVLLPPVSHPVVAPDSSLFAEPSGLLPAIAAPRRSGGRPRVLVADDSPEVLELVSEVLADLDLEVVAVQTGTAALDRFRAEPSGFDLVLLDITMPGLSGVAVMSQIRLLSPGVPVVLTSGYASQSVELGGQSAPDAFLEKPYRVERLIRTVRSLLPPDVQPPDTDQAQSST